MNMIHKNDTEIKQLQQKKDVFISQKIPAVITNIGTVKNCEPEPPESIKQQGSAANEFNNTMQSSPYNYNHRKLYDLPSFDGTPEDWPLFYTSFNETTDAYTYYN